MPNCDICNTAFGIEVCINLDPPDDPDAYKIKALTKEGGVTGNYGPIEAAFFYCYKCYTSAHETARNANPDSYPTTEDVKKVARQMVIHRVRQG